MTTLIPYASLASTPWKNGGGSTTEIAIAPTGAGFEDFDWRISLATIVGDGPFSVFPGVDRTLALVDGEGVTLDINGKDRFVLSDADPIFEFRGEAEIGATVTDGPTTDFNVMTRRESCQHRLGVRTLEGKSDFAARGDVTILFLADGEGLSVSSDSQRLGMVRYDALVIDSDTVWTLETSCATIFVVDITLHRA